MQLTTKELLKVTQILLEYAERLGKDSIQFSNEDGYYQKIWHKDRDFENIPVFTIGDFDDDIEELHKLLSGEDPIGYEFERLGQLLMGFGSIVANHDPSYNTLRANGKSAPQLSKAQLIDVVILLIHYVEEVHKCMSISFDQTDCYYQRIRLNDRDFMDSPKITQGDVNDDMKRLKEILDKKRNPIPYDLERLGAVFSTLGAVLPF